MPTEAERLARLARWRAEERAANLALGIPDMDPGDRHEPCDYFAQVGWHWLLARIGGPSEPVEDWSRDGAGEEERTAFLAARRHDHQRITDWLREAEIKPINNRDGATIGEVRILWPDRVPALKVWAGQMTLAKIATKLQAALPARCNDILALRAAIKGASGLDKRRAPTSLEVGYSLNEVGEKIETAVGVELLAILGLETLPITVHPDGRLEYAIDADGERTRWAFRIEDRSDYYGRWGTAERMA